MKAAALLYHDVVADGDWTASGFGGGSAGIYKMDRREFAAHLEALGKAVPPPGDAAGGVRPGEWYLTFDDGGASAAALIAPMLVGTGWRGHFFMTTGWIGQPGFLDAEALRELSARGHVVGSHSVSHPLTMASCSREQLLREWGESTDALEAILGFRPRVASVPGGAFSPLVAETAGAAGIRVLFTSEPTSRPWRVGEVTCAGRYTLWRGMDPAAAVACVRGRGLAPLRQSLAWRLKKSAKWAMGPAYLRLRTRLLGG